MYGRIESSWEKTEKGHTCRLTVPAGCEAEAVLPAGARLTEGAAKKLGDGRFRLGAGSFTFEV